MRRKDDVGQEEHPGAFVAVERQPAGAGRLEAAEEAEAARGTDDVCGRSGFIFVVAGFVSRVAEELCVFR